MKTTFPSAHPVPRRRLACATFVLIAAAHASAQSVWDGGGADNDFLTAANWSGDTAPTTGTTTVVQFAGSTRTSPVLNSDFEVLQLTFNSGASAFSLGGTGVLSVFGAGTSGISGTNQGITNSSSSLQTVNNALLLTGNTQLYAVSGAMAFNGAISTNSKQLLLRSGSSSASLTVNGVISGSNASASGLVLRGSSTSMVHLNGNNTFSVGGIGAWEGNVYLGNDNALGVSGNAVTLGFSSLTSNVALLTDGARTIAQNMRLVSKAGAGTYTIGGSTSDASTYSGNITVNTNAASSTAMPLIVTAATGGRVNFTGSIVRDGNSTGSGDTLTKSGAGVVSLAGTNTYSGTTAVNAGTLLVNGSLESGGGLVTVAAGAGLGGSGTINRDVTVLATGVFTPGDFNTAGSASLAGTLTVGGALVFADTSALSFDLGTTSDHVNVSGALTLDGALNVTAGTGFNTGSYTLFSYTGTFVNNGLTLNTLPDGFSYSLDLSTANQVNLIVSAIPEPAATAALLGTIALAGVAVFRRGRCRATALPC